LRGRGLGATMDGFPTWHLLLSHTLILICKTPGQSAALFLRATQEAGRSAARDVEGHPPLPSSENAAYQTTEAQKLGT
jgi:hypothetical protein